MCVCVVVVVFLFLNSCCLSGYMVQNSTSFIFAIKISDNSTFSQYFLAPKSPLSNTVPFCMDLEIATGLQALGPGLGLRDSYSGGQTKATWSTSLHTWASRKVEKECCSRGRMKSWYAGM